MNQIRGLVHIQDKCAKLLIIFAGVDFKSKKNKGRGPILVFVRLFLCSPIHPFKNLILLNVTNQLTLDGNINNFYVHARIRDSLCKVVFCH